MTTMRPKKTRLVDGIPLVDNLYKDPKGRVGYYRYRRPDGTFKTFSAETVDQANETATEANGLRGQDLPVERKIPKRDNLAYHVPIYIAYQEKINPELKSKPSWKNRAYALNQFAEAFPIIGQINRDSLLSWWDGLTYHQQKLRMAEFRRFFNWLMGEGLAAKIKYNPFTTADDRPRLLLKQKPKKQRKPLTQAGYYKAYAEAEKLGYECLQIAMEISRYTTSREADICGLRWTDIIDGELRVVVSKSEAQKGSARAARLKWSLKDHPILKTQIDRARELSLKHKRCPFIISHKPKKRVWNENKEHLYQVTPDRLSRMFREVIDSCGIEGTSFHEVRGLSATLYKAEGYTTEEIQNLMAHEQESTTIGYQNADELPYQPITMSLPK
jgi:integrase